MGRRYRPVLATTTHHLIPHYDKLCGILGFGTRLQKTVANRVDLAPGEYILDVSCGTGTLAVLLKQRVPEARVIGVDIDPNILKIAKQKAVQAVVAVQFVSGPAENLPFPSSTFDAVTSTLALHHLPTHAKREAFSEMHRVLKKGGRLLVVDFGRPTGVLARLISLPLRFNPLEYTRDGVLGLIPKMMREAGFVAIEHTRLSAGILSLYQANKR